MSPDAASRFADRHPLRRSAPSRHSAFRCFAASCAIWVLSGLWPGSLAISAGASTDDAPVIVGCLEDDPPFSAQSAGEAPRGLLPDLWRLWARTTGRDVSFRCGPRSAIVDELSSGRVTVHAGVVPSSELDRFVVYGEPLYPVSSAVVHRRDLTDPLTLEGRTLGVRRGSAEARLAASAFPRARIVETEGPEGLFQGLVRGDIDAALTGTLSAADLARQPALHDRFTVAAARYLENQFRPAMLRSRGHEITAIDRGFAQIDADAVSAIEKRWIAEPELRRLSHRHRGPALTPQERDFLAAHPVVRYGLMGTDWSPVEILAEDGSIGGITPAFRDLVAARLGIRFEAVRTDGWTDLDARLRRREVDVTGSLADAPSRRDYLTTTRPYLTGELGIVTRTVDASINALADLSGRRIAMETGYATTLWIERNFPTARIVAMPDTTTALRAVSEGRADAYLGGVMTTTHAIRQLLLTNLRVIGTNEVFPFELRFGVRSDWPLLASILDKAVASLSPAERDAIRDRWVSATVVEQRDWRRALPVVAPSFAALVVIIGAVTVWNRRLRREIDERRRAQAALDEQIAFRSALLDALAEPVVFKDGTGRYLGCNRAFEEFYGVRREDLVGRRISEVRHVEDSTRAQVLAADEAVLAGGETRTVRLRTRRRDGSLRDILYSLSSLPRATPDAPPGGLVGVIVDVTDLEAARTQARAAETLLRDITDTAPGVVWRYESRPGERGRFSFVSAGIRALHGVDPQAAIEDARVVFNTMIEPDRSALIARINAPGDTPVPLQTEYRSRLPDGSLRSLSVRAQPRMQSDGAVFWDGTAFDVSDEKRLQAELAEARMAAESANRAKSRFLAKISHEIRTPLAGMIGMLRLIRGSPPPGDPDRMLGRVEGSALSLLRVLNDILDLSKMEAGRLTLETADFDLFALTDEAVAVAAGLRGGKALDVRLSRASDLPRMLHGDALRVRQILDNLLSNAVKFTERGSVTLTVAPDPDGSIRFEVRDTGSGFDAAAREALFQPYRQAGVDTARRYGGTGLGLAICRELATMMGGRIGASSEPGRGACFWFTLPLSAASAAAELASHASAEDAAFDPPDVDAARSAGCVVLIADDDDLYREVIERQLQRLGCVVESCRNGAEIVAALAREPSRYGLLVTDGHMPVLDGFSLMRRLRTQPPGTRRPLPVILLSATTGIAEPDAPDRDLADAFFQKPVTLATLDGALHRLAPEVVALRRPASVAARAAVDLDAGEARHFNRDALGDLLGTEDPAEWGPFCRSAVRALSSLPVRVAAAVGQRDARQVMDIAHAAKGSAGAAGADRLADLMRELFGAARDDQWERAEAIAARVAEACAAFAHEVDAAFPVRRPA